LEPLLLECKPEDVLTISCRNRTTAAIKIEGCDWKMNRVR